MQTTIAFLFSPLGRRSRSGLAWLLALALWQGASAADWVLVTSTQNPLPKLTKEQAANIFLGQISELPGTGRIIPVDLAETSPLRLQFYGGVANKTPVQVRMHWSKMIFNGKGKPPQEVESSNDMKRLLNASPTSIGYIDKLVVDGTLKVLLSP